MLCNNKTLFGRICACNICRFVDSYACLARMQIYADSYAYLARMQCTGIPGRHILILTSGVRLISIKEMKKII